MTTGNDSRRVEANGLTFQVTDVGEGQPVVFLHGFPDTSDLWRNQITALVDAGYRCIAPDMRGRGRTDAPDSVADYSLTNMVVDVTEIMDALDIEKAHIVGHD
jgi:pimeloyl-ACP methyl ester carboxylesterase